MILGFESVHVKLLILVGIRMEINEDKSGKNALNLNCQKKKKESVRQKCVLSFKMSAIAP